jgi:hypothetical protein
MNNAYVQERILKKQELKKGKRKCGVFIEYLQKFSQMKYRDSIITNINYLLLAAS